MEQFSQLTTLSMVSTTRVKSFEFRVLHFRDLGASFSSLGCFVFEIWVLRFRVLGTSFSRFGCFVFEIWVLCFRVLGASFSRFGCFVLHALVFVFEGFVFETTSTLQQCPFNKHYIYSKGCKFRDFGLCLLNKQCMLNTGFTVAFTAQDIQELCLTTVALTVILLLQLSSPEC